jgi:hypothetical protein
LARCKGGSMCSTGCFAKFGSPQLDGLLSCSVEKNDCVQVPGKENYGWKTDTLDDLPGNCHVKLFGFLRIPARRCNHIEIMN